MNGHVIPLESVGRINELHPPSTWSTDLASLLRRDCDLLVKRVTHIAPRYSVGAKSSNGASHLFNETYFNQADSENL